MKKRIISFLLAMVLVLGLIPATATTANAASKWTTSAKAIELLARFQGFEAKEYQVGGKTLIGYGTEVKSGAYKNGITESEALQLLKNDVKDRIDKALNNFAAKNNRDLTQYEHDALAIFTFGYGSTAWLEGNGPLRDAVLHGSAADIISALGKNHGGKPALEGQEFQYFDGLMNRRLAEANLYLNGNYNYNAPANYTYVVLDANGDEKASAGDQVIAYDTKTAPVLSVVPEAQAGKEFIGWYLYDGISMGLLRGEPVTRLDETTAGKLLVAKFITSGTEQNTFYSINTTTLRYREVFYKTHSKSEFLYGIQMEFSNAWLRTGVKGKLKNNTIFTVTKETMIDGIKWIYGAGTDEDGNVIRGWVYYGGLPEDSQTQGTILATAKITATEVNVYEGATNGEDVYDGTVNGTGIGATRIVGTLKKGDVVNIYAVKIEPTEVGNKSWGKVSYNGINGWINLAYAEVSEAEDGDDQGTVGTTGTIVGSDYVNVRSSAGIKTNNLITKLPRGTKVLVVDTKTVSGAQWGKVKWDGLIGGYDEGWVYMYYIQLDGAINDFGGGNSSNEPVLYTGVVSSNINLNVRKKPNVTSTKVDSLANGTKINIYEVTTTNGVKWGRIGENRWVCLTYVTLTAVESSGSGSTTTTTTSLQGTVTVTTLDVLKNYNSNSEKVGTLKKGDVVTILEKNTETTNTGTRIWGRIATNAVSGWINLAYVELKTVTSVNGGGSTGTGSTSGSNNANGAVATISNCISVNVREAAGTANKQITKLNNGTVVNVYEQVTKDNAPWARITWNGGANSGWVCMNYVTMNAPGTGNTEGGLVNGTNSNTISATGYVNSNIDLNVRSVAGLNGIKLGSLKKGTKVTVYEQVTADGMIWGRIQYGNGSGWVCMSYITVESASNTGKGVMGTIARCFAAVNVRSAPGTGNALIGKINVGTRVEVFETRTYSNQLWGRVAQGWICMDYVLLDSELPEGEIMDAPTTAPSTEAPAATQETVNRDNEVDYKINGTVNRDIDVRNDADADSVRVGTVKNGLSVNILALKQNGAELWGRIDQYATAGWICMNDKNNSYVSYSVHGYVNTDEQPVYANADTSSTVKETLSINKELTITKLSVGDETVYGWVNACNGWIPMGRVSNDPIDVIPTYKKYTHSFTTIGGTDLTTGITNSASDVVSEINGSKVVFKLQSGVEVPVGEIRVESGIVWGKLVAHKVTGWINMAKVNYTLSGQTTNLPVRSTMVAMDDSVDPNNKLGTVDGAINLCELSFDSYGNLWGKVTKYTNLSGEAVNNGGYVMVRKSSGELYVANTGISF